jgi:LPXTG-motif cell wall-anchored protein
MKVTILPKVIAATVVGLSMMGGIAAADISNTGPDSDNSITTTTNTQTSTDCYNNTDVTTGNLQNAGSGNASTDGNTTGGSATSGSSSNNNSSTINVNTSCGSLSTGSKTTPTTTSNPGKGAGSAAANTAAPVAITTAGLPDTGSNTATELAIGGVVVLGAALVASRLGVNAYRKLSL